MHCGLFPSWPLAAVSSFFVWSCHPRPQETIIPAEQPCEPEAHLLLFHCKMSLFCFFLKAIFMGHRFLGWQFCFSFSFKDFFSLSWEFRSLLSCCFPVCCLLFFSSYLFRFLFIFDFQQLEWFLGMVYFLIILLGVHWTSWITIFMS